MGPSKSNWSFTIVKVFGFFSLSLSLSLSLSQQSFLFIFCTHKTSKSLQKPAKLRGIFGDGGGKEETTKCKKQISPFKTKSNKNQPHGFIFYLFCLSFLFPWFWNFVGKWVGPRSSNSSRRISSREWIIH